MEQSYEHDAAKGSTEAESTGIIDVIEFLSAKHSQMTFKYCMNELTRPQLMIWFERTAQREKDNIINQEKQNWAKFANLMSLVASMGSKRKYKPKDFMPQFEAKESRSIDEFQSKEELYGYLKEEGQV